MNEAQAARLTNDWSKIAGESVKIEQIGGAVYGFCSELGALRLFHKYNCDKARASFSDNLGTWFFSLEVSF